MRFSIEVTLLLSLTSFVLVQNSETRDDQDENTKIHLTLPVEPVENGMLSLHCQIWYLQSGSDVILSRTVHDSRETLSFNELVQDDYDRIFIAFRQMPDSSVVYFLTLIDITSEDTGNYSCKVISTSGQTVDVAADSVAVQVKYFPPDNSLSCSPDSSVVFTAGQETTVNCITQDSGFPEVTFKWTRGGTDSTIGSRHQITNSNTQSRLTFLPSAKHNGAILLCVMKSSVFIDKEQVCHIGPITVRPGSGSDDSVLKTDIVATKAYGHSPDRTNPDMPTITDMQRPIAHRCAQLCKSSSSKLFYWVIATSVTGAFALIFLLVVLVLFSKRISRKPKATFREPPMPGQFHDDIYVDLERRRGGEKVYMALEKHDHIEDI